MTNAILINVTRQETRVALLEGGQVVEVYVERKRDQSSVSNIYKGKVVKILPGMRSAFVDIGLEKSAFLYVGDIRTDIVDDFSQFFEEENEALELPAPRNRIMGRHDLHIDELLQEGQDLLVQVAKDPIGTKGARVTSYVTIPGRYLVLMPNVEHVGVSRRIENDGERARLKAIVEEIRQKGFGLIVRTVSEGASTEELRSDLEFLVRVWENIQGKREKAIAPALLYSDLDIILRSVRDLMGQDVEALVVDSPAEYEGIRDFVNAYFPKLIDKIQRYEGEEPIFDAYGIEVDISRALGRRVWLKSGGYIVTDQTEAMTVIDVNTGKFVGKEDLEDTILKTNLEAVKEIAYQIRLRNLGGIIIIDFIDMERHENRQKVLHAFTDAMSKDRAKNTISQISELGLIQMTRKRVRESIGRILSEQCPYCEGKGFVKSPLTLCYEIFRKIRKMASPRGQKIIIRAHPVVAELLSDEERPGLEELEAQCRVKIIVTEDHSLHQENYEISSL
ncbi:MAG: Rne/Rng family ribonuclease [Thermodesulfovibrionales bacterium]|nr:Rne/Rng family ribonuclease [Thermodesulfovibrionales bacterium]